jgi:hypothetical protein
MVATKLAGSTVTRYAGVDTVGVEDAGGKLEGGTVAGGLEPDLADRGAFEEVQATARHAMLSVTRNLHDMIGSFEGSRFFCHHYHAPVVMRRC